MTDLYWYVKLEVDEPNVKFINLIGHTHTLTVNLHFLIELSLPIDIL